MANGLGKEKYLLNSLYEKLKKKKGFFKTNVNKCKIIRTRKILKTLKSHKEKVRVYFIVRISKIMHMPIKVGIQMYVTCTNCETCLQGESIKF